jgi:NAD+ kinase
MARSIHNVLLIVNEHKPDAEVMRSRIEDYLESKNIRVDVCFVPAQKPPVRLEKYDLAFSLGGDGTVLFSSRTLSHVQIPILAINLGDFGFITEISKDEWKEAFEKYQRGLLGISKRIMLSVTVTRDNEEVSSYLGLNDAVIGAAGISKIVHLRLSLSGTTVGDYRADGVIISTPTGSTAYSVAAGGPILDPDMEAWIINPICPFTLSNRPLVIPSTQNIFIDVVERQRTGVMLTVDGQHAVELLPGDRISVSQSTRKALIVRSDRRNFYEVLRSKLNWSGGPDA